MDRDNLSIELAITLQPRVSVNKTVDFRLNRGKTFVKWVFSEAYNFEIIDIRFFSCMN